MTVNKAHQLLDRPERRNLPREVVVDIKGLWSIFRNAGVESVVHKDLSMRIETGEMLSLVGGSGSGKTVLLRKILGLSKPSRGTVTV